MPNLSKSKKSNAEVIELIHHEFNTAGDRLLAEVTEIINGKESLFSKAARLSQSGFNNSIESKMAQSLKIDKEISDFVLKYKQKYPFNKFITEPQVIIINEKYNLCCAATDRYTGFVPEKNLREIEQFKLDPEDAPTKLCTNVKFRYEILYPKEIKLLKQKYSKGIYPLDKYNHVEGLTLENYDEIDNQSLKICAPAKDINMIGLAKIGSMFMSLTRIEVPDPVVLQPVKGGFLIITAWGDEASDPIVVNEVNN